jgi:hypothetical protein
MMGAGMLLNEGLALAAGSLVLASTLPRLLAKVREFRAGRTTRSPSELARDGLQLSGNLLWVLYGVLTAQIVLTAMCAIAALNLVIAIGFNLRSPPAPLSAPSASANTDPLISV